MSPHTTSGSAGLNRKDENMGDWSDMNEILGYGWEDRLMEESEDTERMYRRFLKKGVLPDADNEDKVVHMSEISDTTLITYLKMLEPDYHTDEIEKKVYRKLFRQATRRGLDIPNMDVEYTEDEVIGDTRHDYGGYKKSMPKGEIITVHVVEEDDPYSIQSYVLNSDIENIMDYLVHQKPKTEIPANVGNPLEPKYAQWYELDIGRLKAEGMVDEPNTAAQSAQTED